MGRYLCERCGDEGSNTTIRGEILCAGCFAASTLSDPPIVYVPVKINDRRMKGLGVTIELLPMARRTHCDLHIQRQMMVNSNVPYIEIDADCFLLPPVFGVMQKAMGYAVMCAKDKYFDNPALELPAQPIWGY